MAQASGEGGTGAAAENTEPLFDVVVKVPPNISLEEIDAKARAAGVAPERVEALMKALRNLPQVRIGAGVPKQRADAARETFTRAGLLVIITPLLGLQAKVDTPTDGRHQCPGCDQRVVLSEHRQCPECGVYVDKITEEDILRRKLLRQERAKLDFQTARDAKNAEQKTRESMEAALREKIREELEEEYGLRDRRGGLLTSRPVLAGLALALVAAAFVGGRGSSGAWPWTASAAQPQSKSAAPGADPDKLMESLGPKAEGAPAAAGTAGTATGDADIDDPLIRQAGGERIGAKGLTVEQAVAAAQALAKAGGNSTAERALAGGQAGAPQGAAGEAGAAPAAGQADAGAAAAGPAPAPAAVPASMKTMLALELARQMAEMGQASRAQAMVKALRGTPRTLPDPAVASAARLVDVEVRAWALQGLPAGRARSAADAVLAEAGDFPAGSPQSQAFGNAGAIVSHHASLPPDVSRAFLLKASAAAKGIGAEPERRRAISDLSLQVGLALSSEAMLAARAGAWNRVQALDAQLQAVLAQATDASVQARLLALDSRLKAQQGKADLAGQSLARSLQLVEQVADLPARALLLQQVARLTDAGAAGRIDAAAAALQAQAMPRPGMERARTLAELSVLHANAGMRVKSSELAAAAAATPNLGDADAIAIHTQLIVQRDLAAARLLHEAGQYAQAEALLRRLGEYLL